MDRIERVTSMPGRRQIVPYASSPQEEEPKQSPAARVIAALRTAIARGMFNSGTPFNENSLAKQYNVSRPDVHEALTALEYEGLIQYLPNRGFFSYIVTLDDARNIYSTREVLEGLASRQFTERATEEQVAKLEKAI